MSSEEQPGPHILFVTGKEPLAVREGGETGGLFVRAWIHIQPLPPQPVPVTIGEVPQEPPAPRLGV